MMSKDIRYFIEKIKSLNRKKHVNEAYDNVSLDYIKSLKKLDDYTNFDNKISIGEYTYLDFKDKEDDWALWGDIKVFDNTDGTEVGRGSYTKHIDTSPMKATIDVRSDKRRLGIASNIYKWMEELTGDKLYPDTPHSKSAEALWANPNRKFGYDK